MKLRAFAAFAAASLALGAAWLSCRKKAEAPEQGRGVEAFRGAVEETVEATGSVAPLNRVEIKPPIGGRVEELAAEEGDSVRAGQILAWMSSSDRAAILDAARARGEAELKRWQDAYKPTPIVAPMDGTVILRNAVAGQTVDASSVLYALADTLIVLAQVDESEIGRVRRGMPARVVLDAYPGSPARGTVFDILYEGKNVSNVITYGVKVRLERVPAFFRSQMTANVGFIVRRKERVLLVPLRALREGPAGTRQVLVPGSDGRAQPREVKVGVEGAERAEILSGLSEGERVLVERGRYVPQQGPQSSPFAMGSRRGGGASGSGQGRSGRKGP